MKLAEFKVTVYLPKAPLTEEQLEALSEKVVDLDTEVRAFVVARLAQLDVVATVEVA